ncbi:hypothetical protein D3C84_902430 [compost metagenome]
MQLQLEPAHAPQAGHGRRRKHRRVGPLDTDEPGVELRSDFVARHAGALALGKILEHEEGDARVGAADEAVDRPAGIASDRIHARLGQGHGGHLAQDRLGTIQRGGIGQLHETHQVLFVLRRHEACGDAIEDQHRGDGQQRIHQQRCALALENPRHAGAVMVGGATEEPVETHEEAAE